MKRLISILGFLLLVDTLFIGITNLGAQPYPAHPIQLVIPGAPGDAVDIAARSAAEELAKILKTPIIALNKPGGGSIVGTEFAVKSKKDGYTLLYALSSGLIYNPAINPDSVPYDPIHDLEPLGMHVNFPTVISVKADSPWKHFSEIIEYAQKNPGKFRCGTLGVGSINHFQLEIIKSLTNTDITMVPFKGASPAVTALLGGHIEAAFVAVVLSEPHYQSGKLRGILLDFKVAALPDIPTLREFGYSQDLPVSFFGFFAPAGIPEEAKKALVPAIEKAIKTPELMTKLQNLWYITNYKSPVELRQILTENYERAKSIAKKMGVNK
ncbi:MAG TPA: tripartite tricarboxylate transporter substrate binding protein [Thermodesulfobacteriota bacterium]|nr:tripartite tricarboxylate transporter substrate binding protein [Thermodesulfobacteriota bacterium]